MTMRATGIELAPAADLQILRDRHIYGVPGLLVEIFSHSNAAQDLAIKRRAYARAGGPEYWIAHPAERSIRVCSDPDPIRGDCRQMERFAADAELSSPTLPLREPVAAFFAGAPDSGL